MSETSDNWYAEDAATLGDRLAAAREAAALSKAELAGRLGVAVERIDSWENDWEEPRANRAQMLAGLLGVPLTWLLTGEGEGVTHPDDAHPIPQDAQNLLAEIRVVRTEMAKSAQRLGALEKQLRKVLSAG